MIGWDEFTEKLADQLAALPAGAIVSIRERVPNPDRRRYAQFYQTDTELCAELPGPWHAGPRGASRCRGPSAHRRPGLAAAGRARQLELVLHRYGPTTAGWRQ
ncbi:TY-Chap domain-containing protein [Nocardia sp. R16R-3T]